MSLTSFCMFSHLSNRNRISQGQSEWDAVYKLVNSVQTTWEVLNKCCPLIAIMDEPTASIIFFFFFNKRVLFWLTCLIFNFFYAVASEPHFSNLHLFIFSCFSNFKFPEHTPSYGLLQTKSYIQCTLRPMLTASGSVPVYRNRVSGITWSLPWLGKN